jgi:hypothetical protein
MCVRKVANTVLSMLKVLKRSNLWNKNMVSVSSGRSQIAPSANMSKSHRSAYVRECVYLCVCVCVCVCSRVLGGLRLRAVFEDRVKSAAAVRVPNAEDCSVRKCSVVVSVCLQAAARSFALRRTISIKARASYVCGCVFVCASACVRE